MQDQKELSTWKSHNPSPATKTKTTHQDCSILTEAAPVNQEYHKTPQYHTDEQKKSEIQKIRNLNLTLSTEEKPLPKTTSNNLNNKAEKKVSQYSK